MPRVSRRKLIEEADRNRKPEPVGEARSEAEAAFWDVCRFGNEPRLRRALDDAWSAAAGRPLVWNREFNFKAGPKRGR